MTRRFASLLLAVALVAVSATANALAPTITNVKSPVITDDQPTTADNYFVYQDALNLDALASDDTLATNLIIWSYAGSGIAGASRYSINGRAPMDIGGGNDPNNPGAKSLAAGDDLVINGLTQDANVRTLTFRDATYSPDTTIPDANADADINETITLFASDGSAFSQTSIIVYTDGATLGNAPAGAAADRLDPATGAPPIVVIAQSAPVSAGSLAWTSFDLGPAGPPFSNSTITAATTGLCLQVGAAGQFLSGFLSPYGIVSIQANSVYRFRIRLDNNTVNTSAFGTAPLWDLGIDNGPEFVGQNKLFFDSLNLDNFTAANLSPATNPNTAAVETDGAGPKSFDIFYCVPPLTAADWNNPTTGWYTAGNDASNDLRLMFRILDVPVPGNDANLDSGTLCLRTIQVDRYPLSSLSVLSTPYDGTNLTNGQGTTDVAAAASGVVTLSALFGVRPTANARTTATFANGDLTIAPSAGPYTDGTTQASAWNIEVMTLDLGNEAITIGTAATTADNWPVPWNTGELLKGTIGVQAPNTAAQSNPVDFINLIFDSPTTELLQTSGIAAITNTLGMPKTTPSDLTSFFYTQTQSNATTPGGKNLRLRLQIVNTTQINSGNVVTNTGGITVTKMRIDRVQVPQ